MSNKKNIKKEFSKNTERTRPDFIRCQPETNQRTEYSRIFSQSFCLILAIYKEEHSQKPTRNQQENSKR